VHRPAVNLKIYTSAGDAEDQARKAVKAVAA